MRNIIGRMNRVIIPVVFLLAVVSHSVRGQWRIVAPNLTPVHTYFGAMCFRDGVVWIANDALYVSTDTGLTWTKKSIPDQPFDIDFYNPLNGVLPGLADAWFTRDGGSSWQVLLSQPSASACFLNDSNSIALAERSGGSIGVTVDGGSTWRNNLASQINTFCVRYREGTIYECGGTPTPGSFIHFSSDFGQTWQQSNSSFDEDSYCFAVDSSIPIEFMSLTRMRPSAQTNSQKSTLPRTMGLPGKQWFPNQSHFLVARSRREQPLSIVPLFQTGCIARPIKA